MEKNLEDLDVFVTPNNQGEMQSSDDGLSHSLSSNEDEDEHNQNKNHDCDKSV